MKSFKFLTAALLVALGATFAVAAPTPGEMTLNRAVIQAQRKTIVEMNMKLDEATSAKFWPLYDEYVEAMGKVNDKQSALLTEYAASWMDLTDDKAMSLINDFFSVKQEQLKVKKSYVKKFSKSLPPKVVARFFQIDNKLDAVIANELAENVPLVH